VEDGNAGEGVELTMFEEQVWVPKHSDGSIDEVVQTDEDYFEGKAMSPRRRSASAGR
jgi:hypothetical protein